MTLPLALLKRAALGLIIPIGTASLSATSVAAQTSRQVDRETIFETPDGLTRVAAVVIGDSGTVFVAQPEDQRIIVFNPSGRSVRTIGRRGGGPGEFESVGGLWLVDRRLWAWDSRLRRASQFEQNGTYRSGLSGDSIGQGWNLYGLRADGTLIGQPPALGRRIATGTLPALPLIAFNRPRGTSDTLAVLSTSNGVLHVLLDNSSTVFNQPIDGSDMFAVSPDGRFVAIVERTVREGVPAGGYRLSIRGPEVKPPWTRVARREPVRTPKASLDSVLRERAEAMARSLGTGTSADQLMEAIRRQAYAPDALPGATRVLITSNGETWVRGPVLGQSRTRWDVWGQGGELLFFFQAPADLQIHAANGMRFWGVDHDANGAPRLSSFVVR